MSDILDRICATKADHVKQCKARRPTGMVIDAARAVPRPRGFANRLAAVVADGGHGLIAEIKRASPSKGLIRDDFKPVELARAYERGGATCLSVLTDVPYFQGADEFLVAARTAVDLPALRKDFMLDPYQIVESRALGADAVLLIMAALKRGCALELEATAEELDMDVLVEVHDEEELDLALSLLDAPMIGINNRNLKTMTVDLATTERLAAKVPEDRLLISESGIHGPADMARLSAVGANCYLVGESLMRQPDVEEATRALLGNPTGTAARSA